MCVSTAYEVLRIENSKQDGIHIGSPVNSINLFNFDVLKP